ncbi:retrotransposon protein, putative, ty1-copia subclass [Tanacetum coccineum]
MFVIEQPLPTTHAANSEAQVLLEWNAVYDAYNEVACLILGSMTAELHRQFENSSPYDMIKELKAMFEKQVGANKKSLKVKGKGKANGKGKDKQVYIPKPKNPKPSAKEHPAKDDACHHCKERSKEAETRSSLFDLVLPNGLVICLDNCHYAPSITRGVISIHRLVENGFVQRFTDFGISVSKNNVHYFNAIPSNVIYKIDMHNLVPNVNSIYNVSTKRAKHNLDSTSLWHCRLARISKKCIEKLQHEGLLKSTDDESFDQCVSCLSGKMTRKSFPRRPERATNLLGIIHTDVCGPLRHVSKFMDDYNRYGYVYLLKHKHEVFETFKVFKNEVENQLKKTIKAL